MQHTPVFLLGEFHGNRSLVGYVHGLPRVGHKDTTEQLSTHALCCYTDLEVFMDLPSPPDKF